MKKTKDEITNYINALKGYRGYVQFSHRPIDKQKDIFINKDPKVEDEDGFVYEAHFCNEIESIQIRQINDSWFVSTTDLNDSSFTIDYREYISDIKDFNYKVKMAQIWVEEPDDLCENMKVKKLKKVVFVGFVGDIK